MTGRERVRNDKGGQARNDVCGEWWLRYPTGESAGMNALLSQRNLRTGRHVSKARGSESATKRIVYLK